MVYHEEVFRRKSEVGGSIEVICGSMFSGKTEELIRRLNRARIAKLKVEIFSPKADTRYGEDAIISHNASKITSTPVDSASAILLLASDAQFRILVSPDCIVGPGEDPDRMHFKMPEGGADRQGDGGFGHEIGAEVQVECRAFGPHQFLRSFDSSFPLPKHQAQRAGTVIAPPARAGFSRVLQDRGPKARHSICTATPSFSHPLTG